MSLGGGLDREWCETLDSAGNRNMTGEGIEEQMVGCHTGNFAGLNIHPQPGFEYKWLVDPDSMGNRSMSGRIAIQHQGGQIVQAGDSEFAAFQKMDNLAGQASSLDTAVKFNELVLVRIPEERARKDAEANATENLRRLRADPSEGFAAGMTVEEQQLSPRGPTRFRTASHQMTFKHGGQDVEVSTPSGIVRTEDERK